MSSSYKEITLETLDNGQLGALFNRELTKVLENIADENTEWKATRTIVLSIKIVPSDETREQINIAIDGNARLAPVKSSKSFALLSSDGTTIRAYQSDIRQALFDEIAIDEAKKNEGEVKNVDFTGSTSALAGRR